MACGLVGNTQEGSGLACCPDAQQTEVVQQRRKVLRLGQFLHRKAATDRAAHRAFAGQLTQQAEVVTELSVGGQQVEQLAVVDAYVAIDQVVRRSLVRDRFRQVMEDQLRVEKIVPGVLGESVAVVPLIQGGHSLVQVLVEHAEVAVAFQQAAYLRFRKAQQLVELRAQADVRADVEAGGHSVHGDRRHTGDEHALDAPVSRAGLEDGEEAAVEAATVRDRPPVRIRAAIGQNDIGEVVVTVDQDVQWNVVRSHM